MLNASFPHLDWQRIRHVGFDMDGTLYDEFKFIEQAYDAVLRACGDALSDRNAARSFMLARWQEKGSSYNRIFDEAHQRFGKQQAEEERQAFVQAAVAAFRDTRPTLSFSLHTAALLEECAQSYSLFLVTDGGARLQRRKAEALDVARYIPEGNMVFTAEIGAGIEKQALTPAQFPLPLAPENTVFFGDRDRDEVFAHNMGFHFIRVYDMIPPLS